MIAALAIALRGLPRGLWLGAAAVLAVIVAVSLLRRDAARDALERAKLEQREATLRQRARELAADARVTTELDRARVADRQRQEQFDAAIRHLPDAAPSARARLRLCAERSLRDHPACREPGRAPAS